MLFSSMILAGNLYKFYKENNPVYSFFKADIIYKYLPATKHKCMEDLLCHYSKLLSANYFTFEIKKYVQTKELYS